MMILEILMMMITMKLKELKNFIDDPSFLSLLSSSPNEPRYFVKITENGAASEIIRNHVTI